MGNHYIIKEETLTNIADNIREKLGTESSYSPEDMASGVNEVHEAARLQKEKEFWEKFMADKDSMMEYAFAKSTEDWNVRSDIITASGANLFRGCKIDDLEQTLKDWGITLSLEKNNSSGNFEQCFYQANCRVLPKLKFRAHTITRMFNSMYNLETIRELDITNATENGWTGAFTYDKKLKNITFAGLIKGSISFSYCPLTVESMKSIITHLKNYAGTNYEKAYTLTLKSSCETELSTAEFTDEDKRILSENGIIVDDNTTWISVIDDLKWNLVWSTS